MRPVLLCVLALLSWGCVNAARPAVQGLAKPRNPCFFDTTVESMWTLELEGGGCISLTDRDEFKTVFDGQLR